MYAIRKIASVRDDVEERNKVAVEISGQIHRHSVPDVDDGDAVALFRFAQTIDERAVLVGGGEEFRRGQFPFAPAVVGR